MIDAMTSKPIQVTDEWERGAEIWLPFSQLEQVKTLLDEIQASYWVDEEVISFDGKPEVAIINLGRRNDMKQIQRLLDSTP